jgi:hypothetical protein
MFRCYEEESRVSKVQLVRDVASLCMIINQQQLVVPVLHEACVHTPSLYDRDTQPAS